MLRNRTKIVPTKPYNVLLLAQKLTRTDNGEKINMERAALMTKEGLQELKKNAKIEPTYRMVLSSTFTVDQIVPYVYLGGLSALTIDHFSKYRFGLVINVTFDLPLLNEKGIECYRIPVNDDILEDLLMYFDDTCDKIREFVLKKRNVLVHCLAGVSRSATLIIAYLIKYHKMTLRTAFKFVKDIRWSIRPNVAFIGQLITFEEKLNKFCSSNITKIFFKNRIIRMPNFYEQDHPDLYEVEIERQMRWYDEDESLDS